jgi:hypothetical protein
MRASFFVKNAQLTFRFDPLAAQVFYFRSQNHFHLLKKSSFQRFGALLLALLFTTVWSVNSLHDFFLHHEHPVCEAAYDDGKGTHVHDERYEITDCSFCAFLLAASALPSVLMLLAASAKLPDSESPSFYHAPIQSKTACDSTLRRGPPVI